MGDGIGQETILLGTIARVLPDPIFIIDKEGVYLEVIGGTARSLYGSSDYLRKKKLHDVFQAPVADLFLQTVRAAVDGDSLQIVEYELNPKDMKHVIEDGPTGSQWFEGRVLPFEMLPGRIDCALWLAINITEKKLAQKERDRTIEELKQATTEIRTLRGILPLCSFCKKVRDDKGYWKQVDVYLRRHTGADISHSICPECLKENYPDLDEED